MRILLLTDNFLPEIAAPSFRACEHARVWQQHGHEVTVVTCAPNWPHGKMFPGYRNRLYQEEWIDGIRVIRVWSFTSANQGLLLRTVDYASFMLSVAAWSWRLPKFDVVLATSPQFFTAVAGYAVSRLRRRPWVFEVRDLWPESIRALGVAGGRVLDWLEQLEMFLYHRADRVLVLTDAFRENLLHRGVPDEAIDVVTNGVDCQRFNLKRVTENARATLGIAHDCFLVGYIGTTGMAHGLETVIESAYRLREHPRLHFLIMGEGADRQRLENLARRLGIGNISFADRVPQEEVVNYYAALDLGIVHLRPVPLFRTVIPSKIFELMATETPILMAGEGEAAKIVARTGCGTCIPGGCSEKMSAAIIRLSQAPAQLLLEGRRGRRAAIKDFDRTLMAERALQVLEHAVHAPRHPEMRRIAGQSRRAA